MNKLEKLAKDNNENYKQYLNRMTLSYNVSSKKYLPLLVNGNKILDVGCGSGILLKELSNYGFNVKGIDINNNAIEVCQKEGYNVENLSLYDIHEKFDTIIFSSVLHEFSSYDIDKPFTELPIVNAIRQAHSLLNTNGQLIIRDGIKANYGKTYITAKNNDVIKAFCKYVSDTPTIFTNRIYNINDRTIFADKDLLKEFMYTYTWGPNSYAREVQEQYGILTQSEWLYYIKRAGYRINTVILNNDNYIKYLSKYFEYSTNLTDLLEQSTIIIEAIKEE